MSLKVPELRDSVKIFCALAVSFLFACESQDFGETVARIDGDAARDGIFSSESHREEFCADNPGSNFCSEFGTAEQEWVSAEYHGMDSESDRACYSSESTQKSCSFPALKQMSIYFNVDNCYPAPVPLLKANKMITSFKKGLLNWNGAGSGVTVQDGACSSQFGCMQLNVSCTHFANPGPRAGALAACGIKGMISNRADLPLGGHGVDPSGKAITMPTGTCEMDPTNIYNFVSQCTGGTTDTNLGKVTEHTGTHEGGHVFGFGHFESTSMLMYPYASCSSGTTIQQELKDALGIFNSASGNAVIQDVNLENWAP